MAYTIKEVEAYATRTGIVKKLWSNQHITEALDLIGRAEADLGVLNLGQRCDLLADNMEIDTVEDCRSLAYAATVRQLALTGGEVC